MRQYKEELTLKSAEIDALKIQLNEAENTIQSQNKMIFEANKEKVKLEQLVNEQKHEIDVNNKRIDNLMSTIDGKNEEMKDVEDIIDQHLKTIKELETKLKASKIPVLQKELEESKKKHKKVIKRLGKLS